MEFAASFSGGKDSILAIKNMIDKGNRIVSLIVSTNKENDKSWTHNIQKDYFIEVSKILKCEVIFTDSNVENYETCFEDALKIAKTLGASACVFGDIDIINHIKWNKERCDNVGIQCIHPLMFQDRKKIIDNFLNTNFIAKIKKVDNSKLEECFVGKILDKKLIYEFENKYNIDLCGENGEYHTIVDIDSIYREFSKDYKSNYNDGLNKSLNLYNDIYLDNASTCFPKALGVATSMSKYIETESYSINRGTYMKSYDLLGKIIEIRESIKYFFNAPKSYECIFSPSATYSINQLLQGLLKKDDTIITGDNNHNSTVRVLSNLKNNGIEVISVSSSNIIECLKEYLEIKKIKALFITIVDNISGSMFVEVDELKKTAEFCRENDIYLILDAVQAVCEIKLDLDYIGIDALIVTSHIGMMGPEGVGISLLSKKISMELQPIVFGGTGSKSNSDEMPNSLPDKFEVGTLNLPSIIGTGRAIEYINYLGVDDIINKKHKLGKYLRERLSEFENSKVIGNGSFCLFNIEGYDMSILAYYLDSIYRIQARVGIHCSYEIHKKLGTFPEGGIRFSIGYFNTEREIEKVIDSIEFILKNYR